jgi:hypothetical protein
VRAVPIPKRDGSGERILGVPMEAAYCRVVQ